MTKTKSYQKALDALLAAKDLRQDLSRFLIEAVKQVRPRQFTCLADVFDPGLIFGPDINMLHLTTAQLANLANIANRAEVALGPLRANRDDVQLCVKRIIFDFASGTTADADLALNALKAVALEADTEHVLVAPNGIVGLPEDMEDLAIGNVRLCRLRTFDRTQPKLMFLRDRRWPPQSWHDDAQPDECVWSVPVRGMRKNVEVEAEWQVNALISFLRIFGSAPAMPMRAEPSPFLLPRRALVGDGDRTDINYLIHLSEDYVARLRDGLLYNAVKQILEPANQTVGQHVRQCLGWLSRARQSADAAERLLFAFTAIESLLAPEKNQPVTHTVTRQAATLMHDEPFARKECAANLAKLYESRSKLVHEGSRAIPSSDQEDAYLAAERLVARTIARVPLALNHSSFRLALRDTGFGIPLSDCLKSAVTSETAVQ